VTSCFKIAREEREKKEGRKMGRGRENGKGEKERKGKRGGGVRDGGRGREEKKRGEGLGAAVVFTFFKREVQDFWPEFFASNSSFGQPKGRQL
jgi:hypothetical protein